MHSQTYKYADVGTPLRFSSPFRMSNNSMPDLLRDSWAAQVTGAVQARQRTAHVLSGPVECGMRVSFPPHTSVASAAGVEHGVKAHRLYRPNSASPPACNAAATAPPAPRREGLETPQAYDSQGANTRPIPRDRAGTQAPGTSFSASAFCIASAQPFPSLCSCAET